MQVWLWTLPAFVYVLMMLVVHMQMVVHSASAQRIAEYLDRHPKVKQSLYPELPSHPRHEIAKSQMNGGFGVLLSFRLIDQKSAIALQCRLELTKRTTSQAGEFDLADQRK